MFGLAAQAKVWTQKQQRYCSSTGAKVKWLYYRVIPVLYIRSNGMLIFHR